MSDSQNTLRMQLSQRNQQLQDVAAQLKTELFGIDAIIESDLRKATESAARMLRHLGHGDRIGRTDVSTSSEDNLCTDVDASNPPIEALLQSQHARATQLIQTHRNALLALVDELMAQGQVTPGRFAAVTGLRLERAEYALDPYAQRLAAFRGQGRGRLRA